MQRLLIIRTPLTGLLLVLAGSIAGCDCPGPAAVVPWNASDPTRRPPTECGVSFGNNEYFTHNGSATYNRCGDFDTMWKSKNEPDSNISSLPSDEELLGKQACQPSLTLLRSVCRAMLRF